jgi:hypothetical protein
MTPLFPSFGENPRKGEHFPLSYFSFLHISLIWPWPCDPSYFGTPLFSLIFANPKGTLPPLPTPLPLSLLFGRAMMPSPHPLSLPTIWPAPHTLDPPWTPLSPPTRPKASHQAHQNPGHGRARPGHLPSHARADTRRAATPRRPLSPRERANRLVSLPDSSRPARPLDSLPLAAAVPLDGLADATVRLPPVALPLL